MAVLWFGSSDISEGRPLAWQIRFERFLGDTNGRSNEFSSSRQKAVLNDFFKLNGKVTTFEQPKDLLQYLRNSNDLRNVLFRPDTLTLKDLNFKRDFFTDKTFTNVSFSKTEISGIVFRNCKFVDCLFIGTRFVDCEFHRCTFVTCNPHKIEFKNTYIDPGVFEKMLDKVEHWNIGIHLFQALYRNAAETQQSKFLRTAEFNVNKWQRYVLEHRYPGWSKFKYGQGPEWVINLLSYALVGYGIRAKFLILWGVLLHFHLLELTTFFGIS